MKNNTLDFYNKCSNEYFNTTVDLDISELRDKFIRKINNNGKILDLGCGSGRDSKAFINLGFKVTAVDGSEKLAKLASEFIGENVIVSTFENLSIDESFNGVWACASLLHINSVELEELLMKIEKYLYNNGILYMSFKYGNTDFIDEKGRYFNCYTEKRIEELINKIPGLEIDNIFRTVDIIPGREELVWLNIYVRKNKEQMFA